MSELALPCRESCELLAQAFLGERSTHPGAEAAGASQCSLGAGLTLIVEVSSILPVQANARTTKVRAYPHVTVFMTGGRDELVDRRLQRFDRGARRRKSLGGTFCNEIFWQNVLP